jgi:hypothetical protein
MSYAFQRYDDSTPFRAVVAGRSAWTASAAAFTVSCQFVGQFIVRLIGVPSATLLHLRRRPKTVTALRDPAIIWQQRCRANGESVSVLRQRDVRAGRTGV